MADLKINGVTPSGVYYGSTAASAVYYGATKLWEYTPPTPTTYSLSAVPVFYSSSWTYLIEHLGAITSDFVNYLVANSTTNTFRSVTVTPQYDFTSTGSSKSTDFTAAICYLPSNNKPDTTPLIIAGMHQPKWSLTAGVPVTFDFTNPVYVRNSSISTLYTNPGNFCLTIGLWNGESSDSYSAFYSSTKIAGDYTYYTFRTANLGSSGAKTMTTFAY